MNISFNNIIDISWPISPEMTSYKNNKPVTFAFNKTFEHNHVRDSSVSLNTHTGTHVDAPSHFLAQEFHVNHFRLEQFMGPCSVFDLTSIKNYISEEDLISLPIVKDSIVLFKTLNSNLEPAALFNSNFIYLEASAARYLATKQVRAVGIDYLGIEHSQPNHETHTILLSAHCPIIEGLRLAHVQAGSYFFIFLPLALQGLEAAPGRAILLT